MKLVFFYSIVTFSYTKYFVRSYTVDVIFTLSYYVIMKQWCALYVFLYPYMSINFIAMSYRRIYAGITERLLPLVHVDVITVLYPAYSVDGR